MAVRSEQHFDLVDALAANTLFAKVNDVVGVVAKFASGVVLLQNDAVIVGKDLKRVFFVDVHDLAKRLGENDAAELIDLAYDAGGFHVLSLPFYVI